MKEVIFISGNRDGYHPTQCCETLTVRELINFFEDKIDEGYIDESSPIYLRNDNGYTYGSIGECDIRLGRYNKEEVECDDEF